VAGAPASVAGITVTIKNFSHTYPSDVDLLLVSPTSRKMIIMSDAGGGTDAVNLNITLDDAAVTALTASGALASGSYKPGNFSTVQDPFPAPAPAGAYLSPAPGGSDTLTSAFTGAAGGNPNGTWSLYAVDGASTDAGSIAGGWEITLTLATPVCSSAPPLALVSAQSRLVHGAAGTFDLPLTLVAPPGVNHNPTTEPRQGATQSVVFTFNNPVNGATAAISEGTATAGVPTFSGNDVIVPLTGSANPQYVTLDLTNVTPTGGGAAIGASVRIGFLVGDVNQSRVVSVADLGLVNAALAQPVTAANYLKDVNSTGTLTVADKGITNGNLTKSLAPP
jgi:subtilisin-like proprotein convertase family protein